jgi:hypothetical protein
VILQQIQIMQLFVLVLLFIVVIWRHISALTYQVPHVRHSQAVIVLTLVYLIRECLSLIYFSLGENNNLIIVNGFGLVRDGYPRNAIIVTGVWVAIMLYGVLLCWRSYEICKCKYVVNQYR